MVCRRRLEGTFIFISSSRFMRLMFPQAHDAPVSRVSWAHPEFGPIIASSSYDRTVKVWEQVSTRSNSTAAGDPAAAPAETQTQASGSRWVERAVLVDARGTVRAVEFAPHYFGLKLVRGCPFRCLAPCSPVLCRRPFQLTTSCGYMNVLNNQISQLGS